MLQLMKDYGTLHWLVKPVGTDMCCASITIPIASRLTRVAPDRDLFYKDYVIPAGVSPKFALPRGFDHSLMVNDTRQLWA